MKRKTVKTNATRRLLVTGLGVVAIGVPFAGLFGCGSGSGSTASSSSTNSNNSSGSSGSSSGGSSTGSSDSTDNTTENTSGWAAGGTASMTANFPDDSLFNTGTTCALALTAALTEGPCYFTSSSLDDISEGQGGLPMQLCLRVVDSSCNPLSGLEVEVWHCDVAGIYSGDTSGSADSSGFSTSFCTGNDSAALRSKWFRGIQVTDNNGRVNFASCFPGWYSSRTIHIHFRVRNNNRDEVISQFCFSDELTEDICTQHPEYSSRGIQDTTLSSGRDTVYGRNYDDFLFDTQKNEDGSILVWKTIQIS